MLLKLEKMAGHNLTEKIPNEAVDIQEVEKVKNTASVLHASRFSWRNIIVLIYLHISSLYGLYLAFTAAKWETLVYVFALYVIGRFGVTAGIHRYWSHRSYKANSALRALLMFCCVLSFEVGYYNTK
uniref:Fatty acid desaturase domain-containing protein n=1 Tax=Clastoptera arizonana TaxID=38151 RepID=A0A1B6DS42_9HEMI